MMRAALVVVALVACGAHDTAKSPTVWGWWDVADVPGAGDIRGGAMKLEAEQMAIVSKDDKIVAVHACKTTLANNAITITGCGPALTGKLAGDRLDFGPFTATRTPASRLPALDALVKKGADACDHARACYRYAWPALGRTPNEDFDFGPGPSDSTCANMLAGFADELRKAGKPLGACAP